MEWFSQKTSIAGIQMPNWGIVLGAAIVILFIYTSNARARLLIALLALLRCTAANGNNRPDAGITRVAKAAGA
jgi:hypothetical protein